MKDLVDVHDDAQAAAEALPKHATPGRFHLIYVTHLSCWVLWDSESKDMVDVWVSAEKAAKGLKGWQIGTLKETSTPGHLDATRKEMGLATY